MTGNSWGEGRSTVKTEMASFDVLGPLSRHALANARHQIGAASVIQALLRAGVTNFSDPEADRAGARSIRDLDARIGR